MKSRRGGINKHSFRFEKIPKALSPTTSLLAPPPHPTPPLAAWLGNLGTLAAGLGNLDIWAWVFGITFPGADRDIGSGTRQSRYLGLAICA